jgi:RNA polymerase sigma-70 factor (ECF subfamily)
MNENRHSVKAQDETTSASLGEGPVSSDVDLLERWAEGDNQAGAALLHKHVGPLQRFFAVRMAHASDDLVQATLLACVEGRSRLRERSSFRAYLMGIARNQLFTHHRKAGGERNKARLNTTSRYTPGGSPSTLLSRRNEDELVVAVLRTLPLSMQVVLQLAYWEDFSVLELAEALEIPANAVHGRLHRAKQRLRTALEAVEARGPAREQDLEDAPSEASPEK